MPNEAPERTRLTPRERLVRAARTVRAAARHERTKAAARFTVRHGMFALYGGGILARRGWESRTTSRYERMMRAAEAAGQPEVAMEWEQRAAAFRSARHQRRMDWITAPLRLAKSALVGALSTAVGLLALGIAMAMTSHHIADVIAPAMFVVHLANMVVFIASVVWGPLLTVLPWLALLACWNAGRKRQAAPAWALPASLRGNEGEPITPSIVVLALRDLGIAPLRKAILEMGDGGGNMLSPIVIAGCGVEVDVLLPTGVSTEEVQKRRRKLAENLNRHEHEVFITIPPAARTVRLWIADSGALDEPIGDSPLVVDPGITANYKTGRAPWGQDLRGTVVLLSLYQRHVLMTGLSNQGKTASLRAPALWLAFDPTVEFRIGDLKGIGDWNMFDGLATVLIQGPTDEHVLAVTEMVEEGVAEMERRMLAPKGTPFPPLVLIVDEAQIAFMCPAKGADGRPLGGTKATSRYFNAARKILNQGRAVNVTLWQGTQDPTDQNLPKLVREGAHIRGSLVLGTKAQSVMALGEKAVNAGAAPHLLRQGLDKGTLVVAGDGVDLEPGQASITVRTHYINEEQAVELAERAKAARTAVVTRAATEQDAEQVDPLADVAEVIGDAARMLTREVLQRLAEMNRPFYGSWSFQTLTEVLEAAGAAPYKSGGQMVVSRAKVLAALEERDADTAESDAE
ncbi:cell division protein FtsK [Streptacidiphilus melanogenes]|uniref:cell division protein FtsK n=1 Tax=Streptacidiphilus melanogenes TaxID=411235 RepID=UPI0005A6E179|nr:cell division protein FtsK [Streptacidiphilus melanogenes]